MKNQSSGLVINITYDASVNSAPAGFTAAVTTAVQYLENIFTNPVTLTFDVGYGEIDGQLLGAKVLGESLWAGDTITNYSTVRSVLQAENAPGASTLPSSSPLQGSVVLSLAEAQALGLSPNNGSLDGSVGFSAAPNIFSYSTSAPPSNEYYFLGVVEHEISEVMGRVSLLNNQPSYYSLIDLYRYSSPGVHDLSTGGSNSTAYFSIDNGTTNLGSWNNNLKNGDLGDWQSPGPALGGNDAFNGSSSHGVINTVSSNDITLMEALGWTTPTPIVTAVRAHDTLGGSIAILQPQAATLGILAFATDTNPSDTLSVSAVDGQAGSVGSPVAGAYGTLTLNADGSYSYSNTNTAAVTAAGSGVAEDVFTDTVSNGHGGTATSALTIVITSPDQIYVGGTSGVTLQGGTGNYVLDGRAGNETLIAGNGTQVLIGGSGDTLIGGAGHDTVVFSGNLSNYSVTPNSDGSISVTNTTENDHITNVEGLQFTDKTVFVESGNNANIALLYTAALNREPDSAGLFGWEDGFAASVPPVAQAQGAYVALAETPVTVGGVTLPNLAYGFTQSPEFQNTYGTLNSQQFVTLLYQNVLARAPDPAGLSGWLTWMTTGDPQMGGQVFTKEMVLVGFADSSENTAKASADWLLHG